ncbi:MAG: GNAT family N-acetyltransferase [Rhodopseudomonas palustris]|uniref:GNAT family N-acetyltransferase n=1 Tax=Rhodopseudomonas palustris TaxID=1076 RepID=A0A933RZ53_RHOPL|nr:GNAT family N-acetyltransferase [Rhodopseudomonas palustris]
MTPIEAPLSAPARLTATHDLSRFNSGTPALDDWLRNHALASEGRSARTYVVCRGHVVVGYYCIATGSVERRALPPKLKRDRGLPHQIPVAIIGRLARDGSCKGIGLGPDLLQIALVRILSASRIVGVRAVLVHAVDDKAAAFWKAHDFIECPIGSRTFFLPVETIQQAL